MALAVAFVGATHVSELQGQQPVGGASPDSTQVAEAQEGPKRPSPGGAFARSIVLPGWGQAAAGATTRGWFYFTVESVSVWMILKTSKLLGSASDILAMRRLEAEERLAMDPLIEPGDLAAAIEAALPVLSAFELKEIRRQQREDWIAFGLFFLLLGGADAFVSAHLADFPEPLETVIRPLPQMGVELGFRFVF